MKQQIETAARIVAEADAIFISAGAGMGVDSGLPDFRGDEGFWKAYPLLREENLSFQDLANPAWFHDDPSKAWGFYGHRYNLYKSTHPHQGFSILSDWCKSKQCLAFVFTSNVDGHFQKSGFSPSQIFECHGSINYLQCAKGCSHDIWPTGGLEIDVDLDTLKAKGDLPRCPKCCAIARPNILMFGDGDWLSYRAQSQNQRYQNWRSAVSGKSIAVIELGAGKAIPTVRYESEAQRGSLIRINPRDSDGPKNTVSIAMGALEGLQAINNQL